MDTIPRERWRIELFTSLFRNCVQWLYRQYIQPKSEDRELKRKEFILNVILVGTIVFLSAFELLLIYGEFIVKNDPEIPFFLFTNIYLVSLYLLHLSRKGHVVAVSYALILLYFAGLVFGTIMWGPDLYQIVVTYALVIVITGILFNLRVSIFVVSITTLIIAGTIYANNHGFITFDHAWRTEHLEFNDAIELSATFFMITLISWLSNREIAKSLSLARQSEAALLEERDLLEIKVEERTKEIRRLQNQKISELYRFAEFGRLSSGIFHDLINPLSAVMLNVKELESNTAHQMKECIARAIVASNKMEKFIGIVQKQLQSESSQTFFNIEKEIDEVVILLNHKIKKAGAIVHVHMTNTIEMYGSPIKFQQVMANLVSNAIDASEHLEHFSEKKTVTIMLHENNGQIEINISDNGCGIRPELIEKIFDPFFTTKTSQKGMGLGLSTTKDIVEKDFNGSIKVKSEEYKGSTFTLILPVPQRV